MPLTKAAVCQPMCQEEAIPVVQPDAVDRIGAPRQRREFERAEARREMVQKDRRVVATAPQARRKRQRFAQIGRPQQRLRAVEGVLVKRDDFVHHISGQDRRGLGSRQQRDMGSRLCLAQRRERGRREDQVANIGKLDDQETA